MISEWSQSSKGPLILWTHPVHGTYVHGLFRMLDQEGFPLSESLAQCKRFNFKPCLDGFRLDAAKAGWDKDKTETKIQEALVDLN